MKPIYSMSPDPRRNLVQSFAGKQVTVVVSPFRSRTSATNQTFTGTCLGVGVTNNGTASDQLILDRPRSYLACLSLATVLSIEAV